MTKLKKKNKSTLHPLMSYVILTLLIIVISGILHVIDVQSTYYTVNSVTLELNPITEVVTSLFSLSGIKYIFANTVSNFANFTVLSNLIIY